MKTPTHTDKDVAEMRSLYFAHYTPKEAAEHFANQNKHITAGTVTRYYSYFRQSNLDRYDKSKLIPLSPYANN